MSCGRRRRPPSNGRKSLKAKTVASLLHGAGSVEIEAGLCAQALAEAGTVGAYEFTRYKSAPADEPRSEIASLVIIEREADRLNAIRLGVKKGQIIADAEKYGARPGQ